MQQQTSSHDDAEHAALLTLIVDTIARFRAEEDRPPTYRQVMDVVGIESTGKFSLLVDELAAQGRVGKNTNGHRILYVIAQDGPA